MMDITRISVKQPVPWNATCLFFFSGSCELKRCGWLGFLFFARTAILILQNLDQTSCTILNLLMDRTFWYQRSTIFAIPGWSTFRLQKWWAHGDTSSVMERLQNSPWPRESFEVSRIRPRWIEFVMTRFFKPTSTWFAQRCGAIIILAAFRVRICLWKEQFVWSLLYSLFVYFLATSLLSTKLEISRIDLICAGKGCWACWRLCHEHHASGDSLHVTRTFCIESKKDHL